MPVDVDDLERLKTIEQLAEGEKVLSVYLPEDQGASALQANVARLMDLLKPLRDGAEGEDAERIEAESERAIAHVREQSLPAGRSLAVFSSVGRDLFEVFPVQVDLPAAVRYEAKPYLIPLRSALENYPRVMVAAVDEKEARLITALLGSRESSSRVTDPVQGRHRQGGWSAFRYERNRVHHVQEHLQHVAGLLQQRHDSPGYERLVLAGTPETASALYHSLPQQLRELVAGSVRTEMFASDSDVLERALPVAEEAERKDELRLVRGIIDREGPASNSALGRDETFDALQAGRVHVLAVGSELLAQGAADSLVLQAWDSGASVEFVEGEAEELLREHGGVGALLRY